MAYLTDEQGEHDITKGQCDLNIMIEHHMWDSACWSREICKLCQKWQ